MSALTPEVVSVEDFVKTTLNQITRALEGQSLSHRQISVAFELGVVATRSKTAKTDGGIGLGVASVLKVGSFGQSTKDKQQTEYNRISFTVPLELDEKKVNTSKPFLGAAL